MSLQNLRLACERNRCGGKEGERSGDEERGNGIVSSLSEWRANNCALFRPALLLIYFITDD